MRDTLEEFYTLMARLLALPDQGSPLATYTGRSTWPSRGVYFFMEPGELRGDQLTARVVRVGTHALGRGSKSNLWGRLRAHRGSVDGRGNHRGSVFRLHVGSALYQRGGFPEGRDTWSRGQSAPRSVRELETPHERRVSAHIGAMPIAWLAVPDEPGPQSARGRIERNCISLLSAALNPADAPSAEWLGLLSPRHEIRESGLWNLNHVEDSLDPGFIDEMTHLVDQMGR